MEKYKEKAKEIEILWNESKLRCNRQFPDWDGLSDNKCAMQKDKNTIAIIGDSHAGHLFSGLAEQTRENEGIAVFPISCGAPLIDIKTGTKAPKAGCMRDQANILHKQAFDYIFKHPEIKTVVLAHNPHCSAKDAIDTQNPNEKNPLKVIENGMKRTFKRLSDAGKKVVVVLDNPKTPKKPSGCIRSGINEDKCKFNKSEYIGFKPIQNYNNLAKMIAKDYKNISFVDLSNILCDKDFCYISKNGKVLYRDNNHLNYNGSALVSYEIMKVIRQ